ncbi:hypothetical protein EON64_11175 [archaeon]|nr:MAG: hypothetical protein EON64_11175 [archaeon]
MCVWYGMSIHSNIHSCSISIIITILIVQVEAAAETNMPLCMRSLHGALKKESKLKHWGRLQYGLFLKGAGMDLEGATQFFQAFFTKAMSLDQFTKSYAYSLRHMYGKEGARKNYTPYSCLKIILGNPPEPGAHHGCPYKHSGDAQLVSMLTSQKLGMGEVKEIVGLAKGGAYQMACQKHFDVTHPGHYQMELKTVSGFWSIFLPLCLLVSYLILSYLILSYLILSYLIYWM